MVQKVTALLTIRFQERFHWAVSFDSGFAMRYAKLPATLTADAAIVEFLASLPEHALPSGTVAIAPPVCPPVAIHIFNTAATSMERAPLLLNWAVRSLSSYPSDLLYFYVPQLVQALHHDSQSFIKETILSIARESPLFAHQVIWNMRANLYTDDAGVIESPLAPKLRPLIALIEAGFTAEQAAFYQREFAFFAKVTAISGVLKPHTRKDKSEKKRIIDMELAKVQVDAGVYLPSNPESTIVDIDYSSGRPLQSAAKVRIDRHDIFLHVGAIYGHFPGETDRMRLYCAAIGHLQGRRRLSTGRIGTTTDSIVQGNLCPG